ncbi:MAG: YifB family Mg chelatase-like AAA ATPase [Candidatus Paceibacterota bacterium]|jgi:magnesium chelatase family protein
MFSKVYSAQPTLLGANMVSVEVDVSRGLHSFNVVGLPDKAVEEARDRVSAAIKNTGFKPPKSKNEKIIISLAPADLKKEGPLFDVPIALAYLQSSGDIDFIPDKKIFLGELSLDGSIRSVRGVLPIAREIKQKGFTEIFVPKENADEATLIDGLIVYGVGNLKELIEHLTFREATGGAENQSKKKKLLPAAKSEGGEKTRGDMLDLCDIRGQESAKRGLEIAAGGGHNIAFYGPPGTGKTMLARAFAGILPELDRDSALEVTSIHSVAGLLRENIMREAPFRAPHHTASYVSIIGGGATPKPGEVTLAHRGVLFLDEFPEFDKRVLESLRQPLEDKMVHVSRAKGTAIFPANFILVAAMNPCPCGNNNVKGKRCSCSPGDIARYKRKLSGPIMDRIDLWLEVGHIDYEKLSEKASGEGSREASLRVKSARETQAKRFAQNKNKIKTNSDVGVRLLEKLIPITDDIRKLLNESARKLDLSPRAYHKTIKVARTIADLDGSDSIGTKHLLEALRYRPRDII